MMIHRHLNHQEFTLAAIDDVIARGDLNAWLELRQALLQDRFLFEKILQICQVHLSDPYAQRYYFWKNYAEQKLARLGASS